MQPRRARTVSSIMRRSLLAISALLSVACTEDIGGGPSFGSGSGAPTAADTMSSSADGSSGLSGTASTDGGATSAGADATGGASSETAAGESSPATSDGTSTGDMGSTGGSGATSTDPTAESSGDPTIGGTPLDPDLDVPDEGESCSFPGSLNECPGVATVCRFYSAEEGRCESCDNCGNLNAPCTRGTDCDILFSCFAGRCTNFCQLGTFSCGPIEDCLDIGHATQGVCDPFA
ncbi:MAG: hypothetical protein KUG77_27870 [Nannocystaceae bacterium]|nr:hypothetical protein [Nannocystaceae bacterium]